MSNERTLDPLNDTFNRSFILQIAGKEIRCEDVSDSDRALFNDLIRIGKSPAPVHVWCAERHGNILLYGLDDPPTEDFLRIGDGFQCTTCGGNANVWHITEV